MAAAVTLQLLQQTAGAAAVQLCTAGTHVVVQGKPMETRAAQTLRRHGYNLWQPGTRAVRRSDFLHFDQILAMDRRNLADLRALCPTGHLHKLQLFLHCARDAPVQEVPDPYFGSWAGFEQVLGLCEAGARGLLRYGLDPAAR